MSTTPKALELADWLDRCKLPYDPQDVSDCAAELRRQHGEIEGLQPAAIMPAFLGLPKRKLDELLAQGFRVSGFSIERTVPVVERGFVTAGGLVGWWTPGLQALQALQRANEAMEALRVRCEQAEAAIDAAQAVELERNELRAQVEALTAHVKVLTASLRATGVPQALLDRMLADAAPSPLTRPAVPEGYADGIEEFYFHLEMKAAKHSDSNPATNAEMQKERTVVMEWARDARRELLAAAPQPPGEVAGVVISDDQIAATAGRLGGFSESRPLGQQWDNVYALVRKVIQERGAAAPQPEVQAVMPVVPVVPGWDDLIAMARKAGIQDGIAGSRLEAALVRFAIQVVAAIQPEAQPSEAAQKGGA